MLTIAAMLTCSLVFDENSDKTPLIFKDKKANVILVIESNRMRVTCLTPDGEFLWHKDLSEADWIRRRGTITKVMTISARDVPDYFEKGNYAQLKIGLRADVAINLKTGTYYLLGAD
jgi:hypothetical protein